MPVPTVRERILTAATHVMQTQGASRFAQPAVAREAGVPQGHLTYYFPRRSDLLVAMAAQYVDAMAQQLLLAVQATVGEGPEALSRALLRFIRELVRDRQRTRMLLGLLDESEHDPLLKEQLWRSAAQVRTLLAQMLGLEPDQPQVWLVQATLWGIGLQHVLGGADGRERVDEHLDALDAWLSSTRKQRPAGRKAAARKKERKR